MLNKEKFDRVRKLNYPPGEYLITGSGLLGILGLREIGDIDLLVSPDLWTELADRHGVTHKDGIVKIVLEDEGIEILSEPSFPDDSQTAVEKRLREAEEHSGLPFESFDNTIKFKKMMGREKDLKDIEFLQGWKEGQS